MANPDSVPACIKALSSTTFVAEVTAPALAILVPLLLRALNDRSMEVQRRTVVVIDNLVKLVRDPKVAAAYLSTLVEGVDKIAKGAAFPEVGISESNIHSNPTNLIPPGSRLCRDGPQHPSQSWCICGRQRTYSTRHLWRNRQCTLGADFLPRSRPQSPRLGTTSLLITHSLTRLSSDARSRPCLCSAVH